MIKKIDMNLIFSTQPQTPERGNLYLGGVSVFNDMQVFKQKNIDCILTILDDWAYPKFKVKQKIEHAQITTSQRIKLQDDQLSTVFPQFKNSYEYIKINLQKTNVFVHCQMGVSRSSAIVIAFLMKEKDMSREDARVYVKERRKNISPNDKFWKELQVWEEHLKKPEL